MSTSPFRIESKEFSFELDGHRLRIINSTGSIVDDLFVNRLNHVRCSSETSSTTGIGIIFLLFGIFIMMMSGTSRGDTYSGGMALGFLISIIGGIFLINKSHASKVSFTLADGTIQSYSTSLEKEKIIDLMNIINTQNE